MLKWFNWTKDNERFIEKGKHKTKNYTVLVDTNKYNVPTEYEMYSYNTLLSKGTLDSLEITGLYSMTTRRQVTKTTDWT